MSVGLGLNLRTANDKISEVSDDALALTEFALPVQSSLDLLSSPVAAAMQQFVTRYIEHNPLLHAEFDPDWRSPCEIDEPFMPNGLENSGAQVVRWRPFLRQASASDFAGLANAIEQPVHADFMAFFGCYWSGHLEATAADGHVSLLQLWNGEDLDRLIENQLGHYMVQRRAKGPVSLFFACTEPDSDLILTLDNTTGAILLERPGQKPLREVSPSLTEFIQALEPAPAPEV